MRLVTGANVLIQVNLRKTPLKLKKVKILGFKSFADKTHVEFHEGITCIVGPNGCGKSNIGDAIRWVLGEQSAKSMRGSKMPDVIFAGTTLRKAMNYAEVSLTLDEINGALPVQFDEVEITRRLHRSGESEYFINGQLVRMKDIHHLFLDSGIGKNNFSIFEQGKIDQIIQWSPVERRSLFDEAAGVGRFFMHKKETLRKMEDVTLNLSRLKDIHKEVEKQIDLLQNQAEEAQTWKEKKEKLEVLEKSLLLLRYNSYAKRESDFKAQEIKHKEKLEQSTKQHQEIDAEWRSVKTSLEAMEDAYRQIREEMLSKQGEKELKSEVRRNAEERLEELKTKQEKAQREIDQLTNDRKAWQCESAQLKTDKAKWTKELADATQKSKACDKEYQKLEKELQTIRSEQSHIHQERIRLMQREAVLESETKQLKVRGDSYLEKKEQFEDRLKNLQQAVLKEKERELAAKRKQYDEAGDSIARAKKELESAEKELKTASGAIETCRTDLDKVATEWGELTARKKALQHLREQFAGFNMSGKKILQAAQDAKNPLYGLIKGLYEYITPETGSEQAVNAALKGYAQTLVVQTRHDLDLLLAYAKKQGIQDFSVVCTELLPAMKGEKSPIKAHFLGTLFQAPEIDSALKRIYDKGGEAWSQAGCFIDRKGVLFFGAGDEQSVFSREVEIKALDKNIASLHTEKLKLENAMQEAQKLRQKCTEVRSQKDQETRKLEMKGVEANFALQRATSDLEKTRQEIKQVEQEIAMLLEGLKGFEKERARVEKELSAAKKLVEEILNKTQALEGNLTSKGDGWNEKRDALKAAESLVAKTEEELRKVTHSLNLMEVKDQETVRLLDRLKTETKNSEEMQKELLKRSKESVSELKGLEQMLGASAAQVKNFEEKTGKLKETFAKLETKRDALESQIKELEGKVNQLSIQLAHVETGQSAVQQELQDRFNIPMAELIEQLPLPDTTIEKTEKDIKQLKAFIESNQSVNLAAIEDCAKQEERAEVLGKQMEDLQTSKDELLKIISSLDDESRTLFTKTFTAIRDNFRKNFQILFKGGEADLELLEAEDIMHAGIEITAKPPGKQMRSLSLLSGGEKCLTAMALLFALFEVKASPFCILDEIDAPLDDSNVERFLNVVKQFIDRCQFIIVTHNKRTMALGDRLYGVSMEEKGVSKLLSMEFSRDTKREPVLVSV